MRRIYKWLAAPTSKSRKEWIWIISAFALGMLLCHWVDKRMDVAGTGESIAVWFSAITILYFAVK